MSQTIEIKGEPVEIKTMQLGTKEYVKVDERIRLFKLKYGDSLRIVTDHKIIEGAEAKLDDEGNVLKKEVGQRIICKAFIYDANDKVLASGTACKPFTAEFLLEKCETRAIGRALGCLGVAIEYGVSSYDEVTDAKNNESEAN